ncbi:type II/IV secretion system protein [Candidatus Nomurabacteria bacterium]|nr:type II/IV secretion system protein [Candidatus Nomurabacteria bacterium]
MSIVEFFEQKKLIDSDDVDKIKKEMRESDISVDELLTRHGVMPTDLLKTKAEYYKVPYRDLSNVDVPFDILKYIPEESADYYKFVPIDLKDGFLEVGVMNPNDLEARDALNFIASKNDVPFKIFLISEEDFKHVLEVYKGLSGQVTRALSEFETSVEDADLEEQLQKTAKTPVTDETINEQITEDAPVTKIVATILRYAVEGNASDVHIEPLREKIRVRFRVDGVLNTSLILPINVHLAVVARIKILARLKLDEKRKPQDGRFAARIDGRKIDFRVSTFPSYYGEKVVMRILDQEKGVKKLEEIGLNPRYLKMLKDAIQKPYGMILISGPTGSGKTTTLYSILNELDTETNNVLSLEDPVEYSVEGVSQSQIHAEIGYTFANGLRTTLRQDPDIIMVGEIRDGETAKLAIQAALTGHLVLSTIHTNSAAGIVPRLIDMGIDPYLIPPTLILGVAQRLSRKICPGSGIPTPIEGSIQEMMDKQFADLPVEFHDMIPDSKEVLKLQPTSNCPNGTRGREAVFEMFEMDRDIEKIILDNPVESAVYDIVRKKGMITMKEDAIIKSLKKEIPFEEVNNF